MSCSFVFCAPFDLNTFQDVRFTSFQAEKILLAAELSKTNSKVRMDKLAAQILLQTFLDARSKTNTRNLTCRCEDLRV